MEGKMRKLAAFAIALSMVAAACGGGSPGGGAGGSASGDQSALAPGKDVKPAANITWWHAMSGINGEALNKTPVTFTEITDAAKKLTKKDASGNTVRYGFGPSIYGWFFEQLMATSGALYADNGNGRDDRATKVVYNSAAGKAILDWWKAGIDGGYFYNPGIDNAGATTAFQSGKTAMHLESSAALRGNINTAKFQVGTGLFARPD